MSDRATTYAVLKEAVLAEVERQRPGLDAFASDDFGPGGNDYVHLLLSTGLDDNRYAYMQFKVAVGASAEGIVIEAAGGVQTWLEHIDSEKQEAPA